MGCPAWLAEGCGLIASDYQCSHSTNPFGPLASLVLRDLFVAVEAFGPDVASRIATIAQRTGLDESSINRIAGCLGRKGFARRRRYALTLTEPARVLDAWIASWDGAGQKTESFHVGLPWATLVPQLSAAWEGLDWAWTGAAGAALIAPVGTPQQRVCYVAARDLHVALVRVARLLPALEIDDVGGRGTFHVVVPFSERAQIRHGRRVNRDGTPVVSTLQLLLDIERGPGGSERLSVVEGARWMLRRLLTLGVCG